RTGTNGQIDAGDVAFRDVASRLLAAGSIGRSNREGTSAKRFPQGSGDRDRLVSLGEDTLVRSRGSVGGCHICRPISFRHGTHIQRVSFCAATVERACLICEILAARVLAE